MSQFLENAIESLDQKGKHSNLVKKVKFAVPDEGAVVVDGSGARISDEDTDLTLTADAETFTGLMDGTINATAAFMMGKIKVEGDMALAMKLGDILG